MNQRFKQWVAAGLLAGAICVQPLVGRAQAPAPADKKPEEKKEEAPPPKITVSGIIDGYYMYDFNHPPVGVLLPGRAFDVKHDSFSLSLLKVDVVKPTDAKNPLGFTATFTLGKTADLVHATEPGGTNTYKYLQQLYGTWVTSSKIPITIDFGKFVTWNGLEVIGSTSNDNYSNSLLFTYAIPFYHVGVRATAPLTSKATLGLYLVNGWNDVEDSNGGKSYGASISLTPTKTTSLIVNYIGGDEGATTGTGAAGLYGGIGFPAPLVLNVQLADVVAIWNATPKLKISANVDYASAAKPGVGGGNWSGEAIYGRYQLGTATALALRAEHFEDSNGLRTGIAQNVNEITATLEYAWKSNLITRLEFRHDHAGAVFFPSGGGGSRDQDTLTLAHVVKF